MATNPDYVFRTDQNLMKKIRKGRGEKQWIEIYNIRNDREEEKEGFDGKKGEDAKIRVNTAYVNWKCDFTYNS